MLAPIVYPLEAYMARIHPTCDNAHRTSGGRFDFYEYRTAWLHQFPPTKLVEYREFPLTLVASGRQSREQQPDELRL